ncbi:hypothetical protein SAMN05421858_1769 [Haladaptatus litoreus]|uniref:DUF354 domain-containing protein n=1 Tax=Haladaptatus litoreus TaxID=553468 RepID=A0A1N6YXS8_9EURY|nr:DUF354 domain-containing protein [Haladaptatus litoreus]SIR19380.1 hypothetical protein SAMN05421858_1769 [Haladaptatus litoreus]
MKVIITIQHPAHVHFYRHVITSLSEDGHDVHVFARDKDIALDLLDYYDIEHTVLAGKADSLTGLARVQATYEARLLHEAMRIRPDVMTAIGGVAVSHVAPLVGARSVVWIDNEGAQSHKLTTPLAHVICTPRKFRDDFGANHVRYDGYHELAYLHPKRFTPNPDRLREHGVNPEEPFFLVRFRQWSALHDVGQNGFSHDAKCDLVSFLADHGEVYVTSESPLPAEFAEYELPVPPHLVHDLLAFADLYVGDSATMATEAAVLGTPAVRAQSFAGADDMTNFLELAEYGLLYSTADDRDAVTKAKSLVRDADRETFEQRRERLIEDKIDVAGYATELLVQSGRGQRSSWFGQAVHNKG